MATVRHRVPLAALLLGLAAAPAPARPGEGGEEVRVARLEWAGGPGAGTFPGLMRLQPEPPDGVAPPAGIGEGAYFWNQVPGGRLLVALDLAVDGQRSWVDLDMDGDLGDEEPRGWSQDGRVLHRTFHLSLLYEGEPEPVAVPLRIRRSQDWKRDEYEIYTRVHRAGTVVIGGRERLVQVIDGGGDGVFDRAGRDILLVDLDGDGKLEPTRGSADRVDQGGVFRAGNEAWVARVASASGATVEFRRVSGREPPPLRSWPLVKVPEAGAAWASTGKPLGPLIGAAASEKDANLPPVIADLGADGTQPAFTALVTLASRNRVSAVRTAAARALGNPAFREFGSDTVLTSLAAEGDEDLAVAALESLHASGAPDREATYLSRTAAASGRIAGTAARLLGWIGSDRAREGVLRVLATHPSPLARSLAWEGTRAFATPPPGEAVRAALDGGDPGLRIAVLGDLSLAGRPDAPALALSLSRPPPKEPAARRALLEVLTLLDGAGPAEAVALVVEAMPPEEVEACRGLLVGRLSAVRAPEMTEVFLRLLRSRTPPVRQVAVEILAPHPDPSVAEALVAAAGREDDEAVRARIGKALASGRNGAAVALLLREARQGRAAMQPFALETLLAMGTSVPAVRALVEEFLAGRDEERRIRALGIVEKEEERSLAAAVADSLTHRAWAVRLAAVRALGALRCPETVGPMVARIGVEPYLRLRVALGEALHRITGVNLYEDGALWARWWERNREGFVVPASPPPPVGRDTEVSRARFYGIPVNSDHVVFVIDVSGSMSRRDAKGRDHAVATRMEVAVAELLGAVEAMGEGGFMNLVLFETAVRTWAPALRRSGSGTRKRLQEELARTQPSGDTNLFGGLSEALKNADADTIFLLSDGEPNEGAWWRSSDILREVEALRAGRGVTIHCVSVGQSSSLLRRLAAASGGVYVER